MRIVVKIGTSTIAPGGVVNVQRMRALIDQLDQLGQLGQLGQFGHAKHEYLLVTSGAIACGMSAIGLTERPKDVPRMQACAAVGQSMLMRLYERLFYGKKPVAQLLLTSDDFTSPVRYQNLQNALHELLKLGAVPVINENDSVSVQELEGAFGDNDQLSALLAKAVKADWLILLTDVDGFYMGEGEKRKLVRTIRKITPEIEAACGGTSNLGRGGMISKLRSARTASDGGVNVVICSGKHPRAIPAAIERKTGTYFPPPPVAPTKTKKPGAAPVTKPGTKPSKAKKVAR